MHSVIELLLLGNRFERSFLMSSKSLLFIFPENMLIGQIDSSDTQFGVQWAAGVM
jgi:hypothetical protein